MQRATLLLCYFLCSAIAAGQQPTSRTAPDALTTFLARCETARRAEIMRLEQSLRALESGLANARDKAKQIEKIEADLAALKSRKVYVVPSLTLPPREGQIGRLPALGGHVEQVLSAKEMLVTCYFPDRVIETRNHRPVSKRVTRPVRLLVRGVTTADMQPGMDVQLSQVFQVRSPRRLTAERGAAISVPVVEPFDIKPIEPLLRQSIRTE